MSASLIAETYKLVKIGRKAYSSDYTMNSLYRKGESFQITGIIRTQAQYINFILFFLICTGHSC